jgi:DtxR family transcriptional regulator, Mn-dependent transcriptional regulator
MSESIEMYLVMTALLRDTPEQPVAVALLAGKLGVTQVSANEMCHKLSERGLLDYQPYKGVRLTEAGEAQAQAILSRRRLWVIFLVANLGIEPQEADDLACQLEHITSERLVTALKAFLEQAPNMPLRAEAAGAATLSSALPVSGCAAGAHGQIAAVNSAPSTAAFLRSQGLAPGAQARVLAVGADGAVLIEVGGHQVALAPSVAAQITLMPTPANRAARHDTWARCSAFWECLHGEACACMPALVPADN